ncbi:MAG TPA: YsnF/AvaK domain-containing protein [Gammaproteobacteria bacterium]|nr:YsnF/AvaK domain-containing protein [Gammaproteobacteria bacterium]
MQHNKPMTIGIFDDRGRAQHAIAELKQAGFTDSEIGVTARGADGDGELRDARGGTHAKEGAAAGIATGAGVGALWGLGVLAGVVPGIGTAIAGGTLAALVSSAAAGAATAGLAGALIGLGFREDEAKYYDEQFRAGRSVVTVRANGRAGEAGSILRRNGGHDISSQGDGMSGTASDAARGTASRNAATGAQTIEAREEQLRINKRPVQTGEVEVRKEVRTERQSVEVPVRKEEVVVERHAAGNRPAQGPVGGREEVRIPVSEERVEIEKRPVVTEDVTVGKQTAQSTEAVDATTRKEEIKVDERGRANVRTKRSR